MKTKQAKEEPEKSIDEETIAEPKTRGRKKATDTAEEDKIKLTQDEPKTSKEPKKNLTKPKAVVKKRPLGIRKALRSKKVVVTKEKLKNVIKQGAKRGRKPAVRPESAPQEEKKGEEAVPLIPASEIKTELVEEVTSNSRSSSPKTAARRVRLTSDMVMMKSVLGESVSPLVHGTRTSPYSMRSERSNSPSTTVEQKKLRTSKPRKVKSNLLNEVVMKAQNKRCRLLSESKVGETLECSEDKRRGRGRSCSRDGSEVSKCSDLTESDISLSETLSTDAELKKLDKPKTDLDVDIETNLQISTIEKVPSLNVDSKTDKPVPESASILNVKNKKKTSLKRSSSIDSDNNNSSNRLMLETINSSLDIEDKTSLLMRTENDVLFKDRNNILSCMMKTFNSKEVSKNIRKARRGKKAGTVPRAGLAKAATSTVVTDEAMEDDKAESIESLSKEINDLISNLDHSIDNPSMEPSETTEKASLAPVDPMTKTVSKFYGLSKPLCDNNSIISAPETPIKDKEQEKAMAVDNTPSKTDDSENIRLHYDEDSADKSADCNKQEIPFKCGPVATIDKLMDRLKEFEEFDKKRQRQESSDHQVMVTNDVVLINKSGADIKQLKNIQSVRSPEKPLEKENVLSCFENNSAISIVKRDHVRKSIDVDLPNSVTLIKRNSISRKESTGSNHSRESTDAISIFEKSLGRDVTLTEIRKSVDKSGASSQVDLHQFATLHPTTPSQSLTNVLDPKQVSITPWVATDNKTNDVTKRTSKDSNSRKSSESTAETDTDKSTTIEKVKSVNTVKSPPILPPAPVSIKSPEIQPMEAEPSALPSEIITAAPDDVIMATETAVTPEVAKIDDVPMVDKSDAVIVALEIKTDIPETLITAEKPLDKKPPAKEASETSKSKAKTVVKTKSTETTVSKEKPANDSKLSEAADTAQPGKSPEKVFIEPEEKPGPSNVVIETPESQKRKENVLRTLGLLTHKAANEAKIEKAKEKERLYGGMMNAKSKAKSGDYTGTLKTVIKLNRGERDRKKFRSSLKMTFKHRGKMSLGQGDAADNDDAYYTIERREGGASTTEGGHRKSHYSNRLNNHETEVAEPLAEPSKEPTLNLVIPEKASSFSIHPGRLCMDQCFYCGGKFGLFDTPCHIAQMKSSDRQRKVLANEEKLTIDSCLCDACYRHVDRRANCPSYRKRPLKPIVTTHTAQPQMSSQDKPLSPQGDEESEEERDAAGGHSGGGPSGGGQGGAGGTARGALCHTEGCTALAEHCIRRKWLIKMRTSVNEVLRLQGDYPGLHTIPLCAAHHSLLAPLQVCKLCTRRLTKHHYIHFIHQGYSELNPVLSAAHIPVQFTSRPVLCKQCRYYCALLQRHAVRDPDARDYTRRLLQIHNIQVPPESDNEADEHTLTQEENINKHKKKTKTKSKRKSSDPEKSGGRTSESSESDKIQEECNDSNKQPTQVDDDIENLISTNKILVPNAKNNEPSDGSGSETQMELDAPHLAVDKQTELQYLLQKQNNPAQFLQKPGANLTQKQRSVVKSSGIQKPGQLQRIHDKNAKRIQKLGQIITQSQTENAKRDDAEMSDPEKIKDSVVKNISLNEECTIESIPNKKSADINTLKNKWQMSESFSQVQKNLSQLSKKLTIEKSTKKPTELKYSNPVKRLETNPSISVRELFPGEEEMNLQCIVEFNNVKGVTPEGWEKCNSTIQYDLETKKLWSELQRPYGNQSSFLRHLVLLEKYFRSGDLVLSHNATPNAANYSDSVQSRLRAFDNVVTDAPRRSEPSISLIEFRKQKPVVNGKSLLKTSQQEKEKKMFMPPPPSKPKAKEKKSKQLPPELIAINTQSSTRVVQNPRQRLSIPNELHNIQQLVKGVNASDPTEVAAAPLPGAAPELIALSSTQGRAQTSQGRIPNELHNIQQLVKGVTASEPKFESPKFDSPKEKKETKTDTPKKQKTTKLWRPTLMPITPENLTKIAREPPQTAVDGRSLPSLVQVMSSGKRYHITIQDYNKMCIMRREKLQQLQDGEPKAKRPSTEAEQLITEIHPSTMLGNGGTITQNLEKKLENEKGISETDLGNAATILKNVGLKNITIAPIPAKTSTVTSITASPTVASPALIMTSTPIKIPQLGPSMSITSETILTPTTSISVASTSMIMPKIPKSLTVIPQTVLLPPGLASVTSVLPVIQSVDAQMP